MSKGLVEIWCEWEIEIVGVYESRELAQEAIDNFDWEGNVDMTLENVKEDGLVAISDVEIKTKGTEISTRSKEVQLIKSKDGKYLGWSSKDGEYIWHDDPIDADTWVNHLEHLSTLSCYDTLEGMHEAKIVKVKKFIQIEELS